MLLLKLDSLNGCQANALYISQEVIGMLLEKKHKIDKSHKFVLLVVKDYRAGLSGLILDPCELGSCLRPVDGLLFHLPSRRSLQPLPADNSAPTHGLYCPHPHPVLSDSTVKRMFQCPCFFFNIVYTHNSAHEKEMSWKDMFAFMHSLDTKGTSYKNEVVLTRSVLKLHNCMAKPVAHPSTAASLSKSHLHSLREEDEAPTEVEVTIHGHLFLYSETLGLECWFSNSVWWDPWGFQDVPRPPGGLWKET
uniref:Uncharacterized protein n=1 Tax=Molossus molossus TaxID=27622 RepID=A0A7J8D9N9_MOLMO|nr:hypothetical protein HJG59_001350 [Molossus molossus]